MTAETILTQKYLRNLFEYSQDGSLFWKKSKGIVDISGKEAGKPTKDGRCVVFIDGKQYGKHQILFMLEHGYMPLEIDHKDRNPLNNRIDNLRDASRQEQLFNRKIAKNNTSGVKNVYWRAARQKWLVVFQINKKLHRFGHFSDLEMANKKAIQVREQLHGEFACHG